MALDEQAKLVDAGISLALLNERKSLVELRCRSLGISAEAFEDGVVILDRLSVVLLAICDFAEVKLRAAGEIIHRVVVDDVLKFTRSNGIFSGVVVAQAGLKCFFEGRRHAGWRRVAGHGSAIGRWLAR